MRVRAVIVGTVTGLAVICSCSSSPPAQPSARALIVRLPGCAHPVNQGRLTEAYAKQEYSCIARGAIIHLATFSSRRHQRAWIGLHGPDGAGCCAEGTDWAATVTSIRPPRPILESIAHRLGGTLVVGS
jgi:hypothetical protein